MPDLGKAFIQIVPSAQGIAGSIEKTLAGEALSAGQTAGLNIAGAIKNAILAAGIGQSVKEALTSGMNFDAEMSHVAAISGATGAEFDALREKALEMGAQTKFSASESASAFGYMAMAGWDVQQMMDGITGIMSLAAADGLDLATTSDIVILLAMAVDTLNLLLWSKTKDAQHRRNRPESIAARLTEKPQKAGKVDSFQSGTAFKEAWKQATRQHS